MPAPAERDTFVGVLERRGRFTVVERLFEKGRRVNVDVRRRDDLSPGEIVLVRLAGRHGRAEVVRSLGRPGVARDVVEALMVERGLARSFDERVEREAADSASSEDTGRRRDLTDLRTFTIDPASARDFDDAISVEMDGDLFNLSVHIADVAAHVQPGSAVDQEALRRGNSVYVPGAVEPMLPEVLSSGACSLVPGEPRRAVTAEMSVDGEGQVRKVSFYRSTIRSDRRLSYEEVDEVFGGRAPEPEPVVQQLRTARRLASILRARRLKRGALGLETSEPEFEFDQAGDVVRAIDDVQTEAHSVIEELMILTNEQVAQELGRRRKPLLYRVHEQPDPEAIAFLVSQLESLEIPMPPIPDPITPSAARELAGALALAVERHIKRTRHGRQALTSLVLRSLKPAVYSPRNIGHAGLASEAYAHFTSPIRRYPDLIVHWSLLSAIGAGEQEPPAPVLSEIGVHCSQTEREAMALERKADDVCLAFLLEHDLYVNGWERSFEGEVTGLIGGGVFISFPIEGSSALCEGFLPVRMLRGEFYELNEQSTALVGRRSGHQIRLGDPLEVTVSSVEAPRGRVDLVPAAKSGRGSRHERAGTGRGRAVAGGRGRRR
jgi:ribonuclease R